MVDIMPLIPPLLRSFAAASFSNSPLKPVDIDVTTSLKVNCGCVISAAITPANAPIIREIIAGTFLATKTIVKTGTISKNTEI